MAGWLYEAGIGENRAALVRDGRILAARIELTDRPRVGDRLAMRLVRQHPRHAILAGSDGIEAWLPGRAGVSEGASVEVVVTREALPERDAVKRLRVRKATAEDAARGPSLRDRLPGPVRVVPRLGPDMLEAAGWSDMLEAAASGRFAFDGGVLGLWPTPAMLLIDVDGWLDAGELAVRAAQAVGDVLDAWDIGGSIGVDFPTVTGKAQRQAVDAALSAALPADAERTALNGFGFVQIVRPRPRVSLVELLRDSPAAREARALMRRAQRSGVTGSVRLAAHPAVLAAVPEAWTERLGRELGGVVARAPDAALPLAAGHVARG